MQVQFNLSSSIKSHIDESTLLNQLIYDVCNEKERFKERVLRGDLNLLSKENLKTLLILAEKNEILHHALSVINTINGIYDHEKYVILLLDYGFDINSLNSEGKHPLSFALTGEVFDWLIERGARFSSDPKKNAKGTLEYLISKYYPSKYYSKWNDYLFKYIETLPSEVYLNLSEDSIKTLMNIASQNKEVLMPKIGGVICELIDKHFDKALPILLCMFKGSDQAQDFLDWFKKGIQKKSLKPAAIESLLKRPEFLTCVLSNEDFFHSLGIFWSPSKELLDIQIKLRDLRKAFFFQALIETENLQNVVKLSAFISTNMNDDFAEFKEKYKDLLIEHIKILQNSEKRTVWQTFEKSNIAIESLNSLLKLGLDPSWEDPILHRNIYFTTLLTDRNNILEFNKFFLKKTDSNGYNALEYHCRSTLSMEHIRLLVNLGMRLSDHFPYAKKAKELFHDSNFLQVVLASVLLHHGNFISLDRFKIYKLSITEKEALTSVIEKDEECFKLLGKFWKKYFQKYKLKDPSFDFANDSELWRNFLQLKREDLLLLCQEFFKNPQSMQPYIKNICKVSSIEFTANGRCQTGYPFFVKAWITAMEDLKSFKSFESLPNWQKKLLNSFEEIVTPIFKKNLEIPKETQNTLLGRSVIFASNSSQYDAFKFLKKGEDCLHFLQESSVTKAFNECKDKFKSEFHKPIACYAIKKLPSELKKYKKQLGKGSHLVYHYQAVPGIFQYPQDLTADKFQEARYKSLRDAAKMTRLGIIPDLASMFHNFKSNRKYITLLHLSSLLICEYKKRKSSLSGYNKGAGKCEQAFDKIKYPNMRYTGLTDLRDATLLYEKNPKRDFSETYRMPPNDHPYSKYFNQMQGLSRSLFVDMLFLTDQHKQAQNLNWQNETFLKTFGQELAQGFAFISAAYTEKSVEEYFYFALNCGIDWIRMARQIAFWTDNTATGYLPWVLKEEIPSNLYEEGVEFSIDLHDNKTFDPEKGFNTNGHQDIGPFSGPLALTEFEKAMHLFIHPVTLVECL
jgi:hypothetical protein